ncbi:MAG: amidophosphoribosyltransferase [Candidatus Marinimicrobia bacterium]|nr:amidophosphoribosyltransferase [Candidatus Neomarinimicrobiota bacterium]
MCGIVGIYDHKEASTLTYLCLYALQHRGQEAGGIVSWDGNRSFVEKGVGLVSDVFGNKGTLDRLPGKMSIGHNRYSTHGGSGKQNIQPFLYNFQNSSISISHNGNLINLKETKRHLEEMGAIFQTTSDTEFIIHLFSHSEKDSFEEKMLDAFRKVRGAFSVVMMHDDKMIVARDRHGLRPLSIGKLDDSYIFVSETCALDLIGAEYIRDIRPGEMLILDENGKRSFNIARENKKHCIFEYVYFSRPDSHIFGNSVDKIRRKLGKTLALEKPVSGGDIVISVPDSSNTAAVGFSQRSEARFEIGLIRNHYVGRTFICPTQAVRDFSVKLKFNTIRGVLENRKVVIVDDSIVRGTTLKKLVRMIKKANPKEIHIRISSPPVKYPCYYGMDFPSEEELIANQKSLDEIREHLGVDSLEYLSVEGLLSSTQMPKENFCTACFTKNYIEERKEEESL